MLVLISPLIPSPDPTAEDKYDFRTIQCIDCYNTDFCVKVRHGMRYWNMTVQWWLHHYIYPNAPFKSYTLRYGFVCAPPSSKLTLISQQFNVFVLNKLQKDT